MCSWCWGFKPAWIELKQALPETVNTQYVLGGLAPDTNEPMPLAMQQSLQQIWQRITQTIPGTEFNFDFWTQNQPRRATYPACRAVVAANAQGTQYEEPMISAIQQAYYLQAKNPSDDSVLIELAEQIGCNVNEFEKTLNSSATAQTLNEHFLTIRSLGAQGFPSLFFEVAGKTPIPMAFSYSDNAPVLEQVHTLIAD